MSKTMVQLSVKNFPFVKADLIKHVLWCGWSFRFARYCGKMYNHHIFPYDGFFFDRRIVRFSFLPQTLAAMEIKEQSAGKHQSGCTQF